MQPYEVRQRADGSIVVAEPQLQHSLEIAHARSFPMVRLAQDAGGATLSVG